jgi:trk system potassium uptake protein TrkA
MTRRDASRSQHAVVVGCGRVGTGIARRLVEQGYTVAVIDQNPGAFRRLDGIDVDTIEGIGYDRNTLLRAGVERAQAAAAVTNGDNSNIVVARTAREMFGVPRVFARIYDTRRAAVYERLGIPTVASAALTIEMAMRWVLPDESDVRWIDPSARICVVERAIPAPLVGRRVDDLERDLGTRLVGIRRLGASVLPGPATILQDGDTLYFAVTTDVVDDFERRVTQPDGGRA